MQPVDELITANGDSLRCTRYEKNFEDSLAVDLKTTLEKIQYGLADDGPFGHWSIPIN